MTTERDAELMRLLNEVLRHKGRSEVPSVADAARLRAELHLDSLDLAELTVRIEERFGVDVFADGVAYRWGEIRERVRRHVEKKGN